MSSLTRADTAVRDNPVSLPNSGLLSPALRLISAYNSPTDHADDDRSRAMAAA
ncbi:hypothetical protein GCM10009645_21210 [Mycolicibacterium poriferae]|uniref:Uncharacterized protein n=1 Tax=Mycolicibacterium poriferae TaxID=39694 RepID=A0A6N4VDX2_9MYCO|nr:hypothetical protein MPOR_50180 [Mycolicibacterium poriferae]